MRRTGRRRRRPAHGGLWALLAAFVTGCLGACAQQGIPPGGPEDQRPPVVVSTSPEAFATLEDLNASVRFEFDERISERVSGGDLDAAIAVSPRGGEIRVRHARRALSVEMEGGFRPGIVYRVTLQTVVADMFGNQLRDAFELVFTTGGEATPTTLAGEVWDRITGRGVPQVAVYAVDTDSLTHLSVTNREGIYAFRYLPGGQFQVTAFDDRDRDGEVDAEEVQGTASVSLSAGDTLLLDIAVLAPDTLPAVVMGAEVLDSVTVVIAFDDFLDPTQTVEVASASMSREEGSAPGIESLLQEADYSAYVDAVTDSFTRLDSLEQAEAAQAVAQAAALSAQRADSVANAGVPPPDSAALQEPPLGADSVEAVDSVTAAAPVAAEAPAPEVGAAPQAVEAVSTRRAPASLAPLSGARPGPVVDTDRVLPGRRLVLLLDAPLERDVEYTVQIFKVVNINRLGGGGGEAVFLLETPPVDTMTVDTLAAPDTSMAQPDTGRAVPISNLRLLGRR